MHIKVIGGSEDKIYYVLDLKSICWSLFFFIVSALMFLDSNFVGAGMIFTSIILLNILFPSIQFFKAEEGKEDEM